MLYGEGQHAAFQRLQEEILKKSTDHTIFAWRTREQYMFLPQGILASHPSQFRDYSGIIEVESFHATELPDVDKAHYSMTNRGLDITAFIIGVPLLGDQKFVGGVAMIALRCTFDLESVGKQRYVGGNSTTAGSLPEKGFIGILVARQSNGEVYSRINAAQLVNTEHWGAAQRINISRTETDEIIFPVKRKIQNVGGEGFGYLGLSKAKLVYISHARPIGKPVLSKEELTEWTDIGCTREVSIRREASMVGSERFELGRFKYTVWLGTVARPELDLIGSFLVNNNHQFSPSLNYFLRESRRKKQFIKMEEGNWICFGVTYSEKVYRRNHHAVFFIGTLEIDEAIWTQLDLMKE